MRALIGMIGCAAVMCVFVCAAPVAALAAFGLEPGSFTMVPSSVQAGAHGDLKTSFAFQEDQAGSVEGLVRNAEVVLPLGFAGYPPAVATCNAVQLQRGTCPVGSQVGTLEFAYSPRLGFDITALVPLFNMLPSSQQTAVYGWTFLPNASGDIVVSVGPDYRVRARTEQCVHSVSNLAADGDGLGCAGQPDPQCAARAQVQLSTGFYEVYCRRSRLQLRWVRGERKPGAVPG